MLKLTQFHISGTVPSRDTVTYRAVDKTTSLPVLLHFLPKTEVRYQLQAQLARYVEACKARRMPVTLAIDEEREFMVSAPIDNFTGLGAWMEEQILKMRIAGMPEADQDKTLDLSWLKQAEARYDQPVSSASQFGFTPLPPLKVEPPPATPTAKSAAFTPPPVRVTVSATHSTPAYRRWLGPGLAIAIALAGLFWAIARGSSR
jgi:hypothetical protein